MKILDKIFNNYIDYLEGIKGDKKYEIVKKFGYLNQLDGPHIDFYSNPMGFSGVSLDGKIDTLREKFNKAIQFIRYSDHHKLFTHKDIIKDIIKQMEECISNPRYWLNYGFNEIQGYRIKTVYKMMIEFYKDYILQKRAIDTLRESEGIEGIGITRQGQELYDYLFQLYTSLPIKPNGLQKFAFDKLTDSLRKYGDLTNDETLKNIIIKNDNIDEILKSNVNLPNAPYVKLSERDFLVESKKILIEIHDKVKKNNIFTNSVRLPPIEKVSIKEIPGIYSRWSSKGKNSKNSIYVKNNPRMTEGSMYQLMVKEGIPGKLMFTINNKKMLDSMKIDSDVKHMIYRGVKMIKYGWMMYSQDFIMDKTDDNLKNIHLDHILSSVRALVDIGLNCRNVKNLTIEQCKTMYKKFTMLKDAEIDEEIKKTLAVPAEQSIGIIGYHYIVNLVDCFSDDMNPKYIYKCILKGPLNAKELFRFINKQGKRNGSFEQMNPVKPVESVPIKPIESVPIIKPVESVPTKTTEPIKLIGSFDPIRAINTLV